MKWVKSANNHSAFDDIRGLNERYCSIDQFLSGAFSRIGNAYQYKYCPAIIFDLWSLDRLLVFDSPDGLELNRIEKVYTQLTSTTFSLDCHNHLKTIISKFGEYSPEYNRAQMELAGSTWNSITRSLDEGNARQQLNMFNYQPALIGLTDGYDGEAHDIVSRKRVAMLGKPIEPESVEKCQCDFCQHNRSALR